jgi:hypothetical protein
MGAEDWGSRPPKVQSPTEAATMSIDPTIAPIFRWTPTQAETVNVTSGGKPGQRMTWIIDTAGVASFNVTPGTNTRSTGALATGTTAARRFTLVFESDGITWNELSRTAAMA